MELLDSRKIASRYAKALLEAAEEQGELGNITDNMRLLQRIYLEVPELNRFFSDPVIPATEKKTVVQSQFKQGVAPIVGNLLELLTANDRIGLLPEIIEIYIDLINQKEGIAKAEVTVPVAMSDKLEGQLRSTLERLFGYQHVELSIKVDPAIIAGAIVRIGDKIIDGSYHGKLEMLRRQVG